MAADTPICSAQRGSRVIRRVRAPEMTTTALPTEARVRRCSQITESTRVGAGVPGVRSRPAVRSGAARTTSAAMNPIAAPSQKTDDTWPVAPMSTPPSTGPTKPPIRWLPPNVNIARAEGGPAPRR